MKQKILEILGYAFDPEIAELKAEEITELSGDQFYKFIDEYFHWETDIYKENIKQSYRAWLKLKS